MLFRSAPVSGAVLLAVVGAANLAIRPADKASQNEADVKRYSALRARSVGMTFVELSKALEEARMSDAPEVEPLRDVAWNDVVAELGYPEMREPLSLQQRVLAALA